MPEDLQTNLLFLKSLFPINYKVFSFLKPELQENVELITSAVSHGFPPPLGYLPPSNRSNKPVIIMTMQSLPSPTMHKVCKYVAGELKTDPSILQTVLNQAEPLLPEINQALWVVAINPRDYPSLEVEIQSNQNFLKLALKLNSIVFYFLPRSIQIEPKIIDFAITGATHYPLESLEISSRKCKEEVIGLTPEVSTKRGLAKKIITLPHDEKLKLLPFYTKLFESDHLFSQYFFKQELALLKNCDPTLLNDSAFMFAVIQKNPAAYPYCTRELKSSYDFNFRLVRYSPKVAEYFEPSLLENREFVKQMLKISSFTFSYISKKLQNDRDFIIDLANEIPQIYSDLLKILKNNVEIETIFTKDKEIVRNFIRKCIINLPDAHEDLRNDADFILEVLSLSFQYQKEKGRYNPSQWIWSLNALPDTLKRDKRIAKLAVENKGHLIECFPAFWSDLEIATIAASNSKVAPKYIDRELMKHPLVLHAQNQLCPSKTDLKELDMDLLTKADQIEKIAGALIQYPDLAEKLSPEFLREPSIEFILGNRPNRLAWMHAVARGVLRRVAQQANQPRVSNKRTKTKP